MPTPCNLKVANCAGSSEKEGREDTSDVFEIVVETDQWRKP